MQKICEVSFDPETGQFDLRVTAEDDRFKRMDFLNGAFRSIALNLDRQMTQRTIIAELRGWLAEHGVKALAGEAAAPKIVAATSIPTGMRPPNGG